MTGKEILLQTLRYKPAERTPWVPFVGIHGGRLIGVDAESYLKSADLLVEGQKLAAERYRADGIPVVFDLQVEAEILGCELRWDLDSPPSVFSHPLAEPEELRFDSLKEFSVEAGRFPLVLEATRRLRAEIGETVALYGLITGPLTLAMHLRGEKLFTDLFDFPDEARRLLRFCAEVGVASARAYLEAGADVIAVVDPLDSLVSPDHFEQFVAEPLDLIFDAVHAHDAPCSLFVCGNATRNLEGMAATHCDNISIDENVDLGELKEVCGFEEKSYGGNMKLTTALLLGTPNDVRRNAIACYDVGQGTGYVLSPGCDLPFAVPPENLEVIADLVRDEYQREIARNLPKEAARDDFDDIALPDYPSVTEVLIDVVTLDSESCAPCTYMVTAAREAARLAGVPARVEEHKITTREGLGYMSKLGVNAIPTICLQGKPVFASIVPDRRELVDAIRKAAPVVA